VQRACIDEISYKAVLHLNITAQQLNTHYASSLFQTPIVESAERFIHSANVTGLKRLYSQRVRLILYSEGNIAFRYIDNPFTGHMQIDLGTMP
jgi:hypothetical protein